MKKMTKNVRPQVTEVRDMTNNTRLINDSAKKALNQGDLYIAQQLFRKNVKNERCVVTLNNLGVFYSEFNILSENLRERDGNKTALHYLKQVVDNDCSGKTAFAIGNVFFRLGMYCESALYFNKSFLLNHQFASIYNLGLCYFKERKYEQSLTSFEFAASIAKSDEQIDAIISLAFAEAYCHKGNLTKNAEKVFCLNDDFFDYKKFVLSYLLKDKKRMKKYVISTIKNFSLDMITCAMVIDALFILNQNNEANEFYKQELESLECRDYNTKDIAQLKRVWKDTNYRKMLICEYFPPLFPLRIDCYI